jgi:hypothetical protein
MSNGISPKDIKLDMNKLLHEKYKTHHVLDDIRNQLLDLQYENDLHNDVDRLVDILIDMIDILKSK